MPRASKETHTPICPKCGYDQSGIIDSWKDACPVEGTCTECGLGFQWTNVLNPDHITLSWYSEHAPNLWGAFKRTPATGIRLLIPFVFWGRVSVLMRMNLPMLVRWCLLLVLLAHIPSSIAMGLGRWAENDQYSYGPASQLSSLSFADYTALVSNAIFAPLFTHYPALVGQRSVFFYTYGYESTSEYLMVASMPFGVSLLWLVILGAVPTTRHLAKLRSRHILRAGIIAMASCALLFELGRTLMGLAMYFGGPSNWIVPAIGIPILLTIIWHLSFWPAAIVRSWRIRPAFLLIMLGTIAAILGSLVSFVVLANTT